jgi:hypothetical protein
MQNKLKKFIRLTYIIVLTVIFIACDVASVNEIDTQFNIYTVLSNRQSYKWVKVDRTYGIDELSEWSVEDAFVTLSVDSIVDTLFFFENWFYTTMPLMPSKTYRLEVSKEDFDTLIGVTTLPNEFEFVNMPGDTITLEDTVIFSRSNGAIIYYCLFRSSEHFGIKEEFWLKPDTLDSFVKIRVGDYIGSLPEGLCHITITAFDPNYYKYHFEPDDSLMQAGVTGGLGLCGSAWYETIFVYLDTEQ